MYLILVITIISALLTFSSSLIKRSKIATLFARKLNEVPEELMKELIQAKIKLQHIQSNNDEALDKNNEYTKVIRQMRAQRKVDDLMKEIRKKRNAGRMHAIHLELLITYAVKAALYITLIAASAINRYTPVLVLSKQFNLQPLEGLLSFPTGIPNAISVPVWILSCNVTFNLLSRIFK